MEDNMDIVKDFLQAEYVSKNAFEHLEETKLAIKLLEADDLQIAINTVVYQSAQDENTGLELLALQNLIRIGFLKCEEYTKEWWINKCPSTWKKFDGMR